MRQPPREAAARTYPVPPTTKATPKKDRTGSGSATTRGCAVARLVPITLERALRLTLAFSRHRLSRRNMVRSVHRLSASVLIVISLLCASGSVAAATAQAPSLSLLGTSNTLKVTGSEGEDAATGYISLLNPGQQPVDISVAFQAASSDTVKIAMVTPTTVAPGAAQRVGVTFSGLQDLEGAATGQLVITSGESPVAQSVEVDPAPQPSAPWPEVLIVASFLVALTLALAVVGNMPGNDRSPLRNPAPGAKWSFSSWATTLTGAGAVFGTALATATLPAFPDQIGKPTLVNLNILFGLLAVLAPFLFQALRRRKVTDDEQDAARTGTNLTLLIACSITLWALLGQLGAFALLAWELIGGGAVAWAVLAALFLIGFLAVRYFVLTTSALVVRRWPIAPPAGAVVAPPQYDVSRIDRLYLETAFSVATITEDPEQGSAVITISAPVAKPPDHWSLL